MEELLLCLSYPAERRSSTHAENKLTHQNKHDEHNYQPMQSDLIIHKSLEQNKQSRLEIENGKSLWLIEESNARCSAEIAHQFKWNNNSNRTVRLTG